MKLSTQWGNQCVGPLGSRRSLRFPYWSCPLALELPKGLQDSPLRSLEGAFGKPPRVFLAEAHLGLLSPYVSSVWGT